MIASDAALSEIARHRFNKWSAFDVGGGRLVNVFCPKSSVIVCLLMRHGWEGDLPGLREPSVFRFPFRGGQSFPGVWVGAGDHMLLCIGASGIGGEGAVSQVACDGGTNEA